MPQYASYPLITNPQPEDIVLISQDATGSLKTVSIDNLADIIGDILNTSAGAPVTATYILNEPDGDLSNAQALSELATGVVKNTNGTGILSIATPGTDLVVPGNIIGSGLTSVTGVIIGRSTAGTGVLEALTTIPSAIQDNITRLGIIAFGQWNGNVVTGQYGGTGVANTGKAITLGGNLTTSGAFDLTLTLSAATNVTLPTTGTLAVTASPVFTTQITTPKVVWTGTVQDLSGTGSPEGVVTAGIGSLYRRTNGSTGTTLYVKETGTGNTGWAAVSSGGSTSPGGSNTQLQYNNSSAFGGISGVTTNGTAITATAGNLIATSPKFITSINDTNGNELINLTATGSAVNEITLANAAAASGPTISATGGDTNIDIMLEAKGTGGVVINNPGAASELRINAASGAPVMRFQRGGVTKTGVAISSGTDNFILGSVVDDFCFRNDASKSILFSTDGGFTVSAKIVAATGQLSLPQNISSTTTTTGSLIVAGGVGIVGAINAGGAIKTGAPSGGTAAAWKFGVAASVSPTLPNRTIELDVGGTIYYLSAKTTND